MLNNSKLPSRLHHTAIQPRYGGDPRVLREVIGLPLVRLERIRRAVGKVRTYCHALGLADGGALAFFQFADKDDERTFSPPIAETPFITSRSRSIKWPRGIGEAHQGGGYKEPDTFVAGARLLPLGLYKDPNGMLSNSRSMLQRRSDRQGAQGGCASDPQRWLRATAHRTTFYG